MKFNKQFFVLLLLLILNFNLFSQQVIKVDSLFLVEELYLDVEECEYAGCDNFMFLNSKFDSKTYIIKDSIHTCISSSFAGVNSYEDIYQSFKLYVIKDLDNSIRDSLLAVLRQSACSTIKSGGSKFEICLSNNAVVGCDGFFIYHVKSVFRDDRWSDLSFWKNGYYYAIVDIEGETRRYVRDVHNRFYFMLDEKIYNKEEKGLKSKDFIFLFQKQFFTENNNFQNDFNCKRYIYSKLEFYDQPSLEELRLIQLH